MHTGRVNVNTCLYTIGSKYISIASMASDRIRPCRWEDLSEQPWWTVGNMIERAALAQPWWRRYPGRIVNQNIIEWVGVFFDAWYEVVHII